MFEEKGCSTCRLNPATCDRNKDWPDRLDPEFLLKSCIWCCDYQPRQQQLEMSLEGVSRES